MVVPIRARIAASAKATLTTSGVGIKTFDGRANQAASGKADLSKTGGGAWTPSSIANTVDWVDAGDTAKITAASNLVSAIVGQMGVVTWSQSTDANKPKSGISTINGLNVLDFGTASGAGRVTHVYSTVTSLSATTAHQWCVIQVTAFDAGTLAIFMDGDHSGQRLAFLAANSDQKLQLFGGGAYPNASSLVLDTSLHLLIANWAGASGGTIYMDGSSAAVPGSAGTNTPSYTHIGSDTGVPANERFSGHFCAWGIGTTNMGSTDRASLRTWAQARWGTP